MTERVKVKEEPKKQPDVTGNSGTRGDLHDALQDSFPASDPPSATQPIRPGAPDSTKKTGKR